MEATSNQTLTVLIQTIADIIKLQLTRRYARPMLPAEVEKQIRLNLRSIRANNKLLKLLDSRDADGAEAYWAKHLIAVGVTVLGDGADAVVDLPE
jgi:DNA-binding GntR family transcriptional regulator